MKLIKCRDSTVTRFCFISLSLITAKPTTTLVSDTTSVLTSDRVILTCAVEDSTPTWIIYWYRDYQESEPVTVTTQTTYTFRASRFSENRTYFCRGGRGDPPYYTHYSNPVDITVSGEL